MKKAILILLLAGIVAQVNSAQELPWKIVTPERINSFAVSPEGVIYASTNYFYIITSIDSGRSWVNVSTHISRTLYLLRCDSSGVLFGFNNQFEMMYLSYDGENWEGKDIFPNLTCAEISPGNLIYCGDEEGYIHISADSGNSWESKEVFTGSPVRKIDWIGEDIILVSSESNAMKISRDNGDNWNTFFFPNIVFWSDFLIDGDNNIIISTADGLFFSPDTGTTWINKGQGIKGKLIWENQYYFAIPTDNNPQFLYCSNTDFDFQPAGINDEIINTVFSLGENYLATGPYGIYLHYEGITIPPGKNYFPLHTGNHKQLFYGRLSLMGNWCDYTYGFEETGNPVVINNKTYHYVRRNFTGNEPWQLFRFDSLKQRIFIYDDDQEHLYMDFNLLPGQRFYQGYQRVTVKEDSFKIAGEYYYCKGYSLFDSYGNSTREFYVPDFGYAFMHYFGNQWDGCQNYMASIDAYIYQDTGFVFIPASSPEIFGPEKNTFFSGITYHDTIRVEQDYNGFCAFEGCTTYVNFIDKVKIEYFYTNGPNSTIPVLQNLYCNLNSFDWPYMFNIDQNYFQNGYKLNYRFFVTDKSLLPQTYIFPESGNYSLKYSPPTDIEETSDEPEYFVSGNYPNPFNPCTSIHYTLADDSFVTLEIFNPLGEKVETIVNMEQQRGEYSADFDASGLATGIYIYRLKALQNGSVKLDETGKMLYLK